MGKLPTNLLAHLLEKVDVSDPSVILGPRMGEDAALVDAGTDEYLVVSSDPITFAAEQLGWYAVHINANDIAATGGTPRWMVLTVILPDGAPAQLAREIMRQTVDACAQINVTLIGGHTEVTRGIDRPIAVGTMIGEVTKGKETLSSGVREGDSIILTKGPAIEGTAILAREYARRLRNAGVAEHAIERAAAFLHTPGISVLADARIALDTAPIHAMHDPTEGGVMTGLREMADASDVGINVEVRTVFEMMSPEAAEICNLLDFNALWLISGGALLVSVKADDAGEVISALRRAEIDAAVIGQAVPRSEGDVLPVFEGDELARVLGGRRLGI